MTADLRQAAWNSVQIAAVAYLEDSDLAVLTHVLRLAHRHGFTLAELRDASGLDEAYITRLLEEGPA